MPKRRFAPSTTFVDVKTVNTRATAEHFVEEGAAFAELEGARVRAREAAKRKESTMTDTHATTHDEHVAPAPAWDAIATTQAESQLFDGLVTEIEFWNASATFEEFQDVAAHVRALDMKTPGGAPMPLAAYIGRPTPEQVAPLLALVDRLFVHVYVKSAEQAYAYGQERFAALAALDGEVEVRPIFSAEGEMWAAGAEHFMGEWLSEHSLGEAEATFIAAWENEAGPLPLLTGFQHYDYFFLERYLQ